ncbi:MAG: potassium transporter TrkG [Thermincola sp.]|nr:potassium transporter TrkG [Thermincola sp.]
MEVTKYSESHKKSLSPVQLIVLFYISAVIISTVLLSLPIAHKSPNTELSFVDALFTAVSAISVTGLNVVSTADTFNIVGYFILVIIGTLFIYLFERSQFFADKAWHEIFFCSLFQSISSRSGGLATMDAGQFSDPTLLLLSGLMFIGASPSSAGGGIRTTTFAIMFLSIFFYTKGKDSIKIFEREIDPEDVHRSFIVIMTASLICGYSIILMTILEPSLSLVAIIFEVTSAFGTSGLSVGITPDLSTLGKYVIINLMFIGRIGIFSFLFTIRGTTVQEKFHYPKEKVIIG